MPHSTLDCHGLSDRGLARPRNEDQFLVAELQKSLLVGRTSLAPDESARVYGRVQGHLLLVADGMGGAAAGDEASRIAVVTLTRHILETLPWFRGIDEGHLHELETELSAGLERCQASIEAFTRVHPAMKGMGTTLTMAYVSGPHAYVVHVGDSRCYLHRDGALVQVTKDHTLAQQLLESGVRVGPRSPVSHVLWNVVGGTSHDLSPQVSRLNVRAGDTLLLCTDGLTRHVPDEAIRHLLGLGLSAEETCRRAVGAAIEGGGSDNVTVVVARFPDEAPAEKPAQAAARKGLALVS